MTAGARYVIVSAELAERCAGALRENVRPVLISSWSGSLWCVYETTCGRDRGPLRQLLVAPCAHQLDLDPPLEIRRWRSPHGTIPTFSSASVP